MYGFVPRLFRLESPFGEIVEQQALMLEALLNNEEHLKRSQKERVLLAVSAANRSPYGVALHEQMLKLSGVTDAEVSCIVAGGMPDGPDGALIDFARSVILRPLQLNEAHVEQLRSAGFTEPQIVEVIALIGVCNFLNTIQFGTGAIPDFAAREIPVQGAISGKILYPEAPEPRPTSEAKNEVAKEAHGEAEDDPDGDWVLKVQNGNMEAFEELVNRHSQRVYRTLVALLGNPEEAKDAVQDTFLKAFQYLPRFERRAKFSTWLLSIASNTGIQKLRERKNIESLDDSPSDSEEFRPRQIRAWGDDPEQMYSKSEQRTLVEQAITRLPAKYRVVLVMRDVQQISTEEAAAALQLGVPALKARLLRGRLMLREALAPHFIQGAQTV